jgi:hypothetical protein
MRIVHTYRRHDEAPWCLLRLLPGGNPARMRPAPDAGAAASSLGHHAELGDLEGACVWDQDAWAQALDGYFGVHDEIGTGPDARGPGLLIIDPQPGQ